jgi:hypothetical protein
MEKKCFGEDEPIGLLLALKEAQWAIMLQN